MPLVRYIGKPDPLQRELDRQEAEALKQLRAGTLQPRPDETIGMAARREALARTREVFRRKGISEAQVWEYNHRRLGGSPPGGGQQIVHAAIPGVTRRLLGPNEGLSRGYAWGPHEFTKVVTESDWAAIQRLAEHDEFVLIQE